MDGLIVRVERDDNSIEIKTYRDATIEDWKSIFETILFWLTFHPDTIKDIFCKEGDCERYEE